MRIVTPSPTELFDVVDRKERRKARQIYRSRRCASYHCDVGNVSAALLCTLPLLAAPAIASTAEHHWAYSGTRGPSHWSLLEPDYRLCGIGKAQSPIDLVTASMRVRDLPPLAFKYVSDTVRVVDNGHTIQVGVSSGSDFRVENARYSLVQFHFHRPSEETVDGRPFPMSVHFVHADSEGHLAVVAVLIEAGAPNDAFDKLWRMLLSQKHDQTGTQGVPIDPAELLPTDGGYYAYSGSLTTPPCSQNVRWFILKTPVTLSIDQISKFASIYPHNARPVQPLNGRVVVSTR